MDSKFVCAPTDTIDAFEDLARELFSDILAISFDDCLVTDESCLCFFVADETPDDYAERFRAKYGFDLVHAPIVETLREIAQRRREDQPPN